MDLLYKGSNAERYTVTVLDAMGVCEGFVVGVLGGEVVVVYKFVLLPYH